MRVALTGASGFIGAAIARHAAQAGHQVTSLVREQSRRDQIEDHVDRFVVGGHDDATARSAFLDGADVVIHNSFDWPALRSGDLPGHLRNNMQGALELLQESDGRQFIYMSSIAVHHHMHDRWNGVIDESHPSRPGSFYGAMKVAVEAHMWATHTERGQSITAIRPCAVYGVDPKLERSIGWPIIESLRRGEPYSRKGGGKYVHVEDVAAATVACIDNPRASPKVYNLVDCYARWCDWATMAAEILGIDAEIDTSSPSAPKNTFDTTDVTNDLGVAMNRGHEGIRTHLAELATISSSEA